MEGRGTVSSLCLSPAVCLPLCVSSSLALPTTLPPTSSLLTFRHTVLCTAVERRQTAKEERKGGGMWWWTGAGGEPRKRGRRLWSLVGEWKKCPWVGNRGGHGMDGEVKVHLAPFHLAQPQEEREGAQCQLQSHSVRYFVQAARSGLPGSTTRSLRWWEVDDDAVDSGRAPGTRSMEHGPWCVLVPSGLALGRRWTSDGRPPKRLLCP